MRYDNWDVILFPKDSAVPIQEFRTACYTTQDEHGPHPPTLTCYIASLPATAPFRVSIHSWTTPVKPSSLIESRRRSSQKVVFAIQVIVDGSRVFHGFYDAASRWPQEIVNEKRSATDQQQPANQRGPSLEFPPFHENILTQPSWNAREHNGRIKVLLSEQLVGKTSSPEKLDLGIANDMVCFAFQHAPQEILEQAGVSWPIRNPLYLASDVSLLPGPQAAHDLAAENRTRSLLSQHSPSMFLRPRNPEPFTRPSTNPPLLPKFPRPMTGARIGRPGLWDLSLEDSSGRYDDMSTDTWSTKRTNSHSTLDTSMPDMFYGSSTFAQPGDPWTMPHAPVEHHPGRNDGDKHARREKGTREVVVTLREDQLGQLIEAMSPPKKAPERGASSQRPPTGAYAPRTTRQPPPASIRGPASTRPPTTALVRNASYQELRQRRSNKAFVINENIPPSQVQDDSHFLRGFSHTDRVPTPHPFVVSQAQMNRWNSDVSMRDTSSMLSGPSCRPQSKEEKNSAPIPPASCSIKSRKEGINILVTSSPLDARYDQSLLPEADSTTKLNSGLRDTSNVTSPDTHIEDIIDIDAVDDSFVRGHKGGMSSIDSTSRLERKLYSALGEELSFHDEAKSMPGVENEAIIKETTLADLELDVPATKRKRQGTLGGERDRSPIAKMVREQSNDDKAEESLVHASLT